MEPAVYENQPLPRRSHGCLWGCLTVLVIAGLVTVGLFSYGAWFFFTGFEKDARLQNIMETVRSDPRAEMVLGKNIHIVEVEEHMLNYSSESGKKLTYRLKLAGSTGEGELKVDLNLNGPKAKVTLMVLTGTDGHPHYLVGIPPSSPFTQSI